MCVCETSVPAGTDIFMLVKQQIEYKTLPKICIKYKSRTSKFEISKWSLESSGKLAAG